MNAPDFAADIPQAIAQAAHSGTSFVPERRAEQVRNDYAATLAADYATLAALADTDDKRAQLAEEFERYRAGYRARSLAWLHARARCMSPMITGPSRFPSARNEKRNRSADRRSDQLAEFRERALKAIRRRIAPELDPIMAGAPDACTRLAEKIAEAERHQEFMRTVNAAHARYVRDPATLEAAELADDVKRTIRNYTPAYSWEPHPFAPYELSNNNANIRRMRERLQQIGRAQATPDTVTKGAHARLEDCPSENRVRVFFPGKPSAEIRGKLKSRGFRWAPSIGCWQAYRNHSTLATAAELAGATTPPAEASRPDPVDLAYEDDCARACGL